MATGTPRHTWTDNTTAITAAKLNTLEQDIADGLATANAAEDVTEATGTRDATTFLRGDKVWAAPPSGSSYTDEQVRDVMGTALVAGSNVTITPNDGADTITIAASGGTSNVVSAADYGVVGNGRRVTDAGITSGQTTLTSATAFFVSGDVGKQIKVAGAGASGAVLTTTISAVTNATTVTLAASAGTTVSNALATFGTDDTAALTAAMNALKVQANRRGGSLHIPQGFRCLVSSPVPLYSGMSISGGAGGYSFDVVYWNASALIATPGFTGTAVLKQDADGGTVTSPPGPDGSWHYGVIERLAVLGTGITGPHGIDPGWNGEASSIRNVTLYQCNSGIYLTGTQASCTLEAVSMFNCNYGLNCDGIDSTVRVFGLSGDNNTSLVRVKGGFSANVSIFSMKAENFTGTTGDPVIDITDLDGGMVTVVGGWCDTGSARTRVVRLSKTGATVNYPRLALIGVGANTNYTYMVEDTIATKTAAVSLGGLSRATYMWNMHSIDGGQGGPVTAYDASTYGQISNGTTTRMLTMASDDRVKLNAAYNGGRLVNGDVADVLSWAGGSGVQLGFYGTAPQAKPTVTGAKGGNAALGSLISALATLGLITDSTT